jgi:predicted esterase
VFDIALTKISVLRFGIQMVSEKIKDARIFWGHGIDDPLVKYLWAAESRDYLKDVLSISETSGSELQGLSFNSYSGLEHSTSHEELMDLLSWLEKVLPVDP